MSNVNNNLKSILGENKKLINLHGVSVSLSPIKVKNLPVVLDKIHLFKDISNKGNLLEIISKNFSEVVEMFSSISGLEKSFVEDLEIIEMVNLVEAVVDLNREGFFLIVKKMESLTKTTKTETGPKPSNALSKKVTNSKESRITA